MHRFSFICFSTDNWEKRRARKQQFMLHLSQREDVGKILYIEPPLNFFRLLILPLCELKTYENRKRWARALKAKTEALSDKLFLFTPVFFIPFSFRLRFIYNLNLFFCLHTLRAKAGKLNLENIVLWLYHPFSHSLLKWFKERVLSVFDWAEDWAEYFTEYSPGKQKFISDLEESTVKDADIVFVVSRMLWERAKRINPASYQILDGTIPELFDNYDGKAPDAIKDISRPVIGYAGSLFRRVDLDLIGQLSEELPLCSIVLVGNILFSRERIAKISQKNNIFLLGGKSYDELPGYMMNFDVCILPYIPSAATSPPTKMYDYLATGKPIVSSSLSSLDSFQDCIKIAGSNKEFIELVKGSLRADTPALVTLRKERARKNSWRSRADEIMKIIVNRSGL